MVIIAEKEEETKGKSIFVWIIVSFAIASSFVAILIGTFGVSSQDNKNEESPATSSTMEIICDKSLISNLFELDIMIDNFPGQFSWKPVDKYNNVLANISYYEEPNNNYYYRECVPVTNNECMTIRF